MKLREFLEYINKKVEEDEGILDHDLVFEDADGFDRAIYGVTIWNEFEQVAFS